jgi:hypothetical protein
MSNFRPFSACCLQDKTVTSTPSASLFSWYRNITLLHVFFTNKTHPVFVQFITTQLSPSNATMLQIPTPPPTNVDAAAAAAAANASAITTSSSSTPVAVIGLKSISATIPNAVAGNCGANGTAQKAANANTKKELGHFSQLNPLVMAQKAANANNQKRHRGFSQLNPLVKLRLRPACLTHRA